VKWKWREREEEERKEREKGSSREKDERKRPINYWQMLGNGDNAQMGGKQQANCEG
jgi:hypothetical protein